MVMAIELLYFDGCPAWELVKAEIEELLPTASEEEIRTGKVETNAQAQRLRFPGSSTVRMDGADIDPNAPTDGFNLECRLYWVDGSPRALPPHEWRERPLVG